MSAPGKITDDELRSKMDTVVQMATIEWERKVETELHLLEMLQDDAWNELCNALRYARTGWSIGVESALRRLVLLLGFTDVSRRVPYPMIHSGMYEQVLDLAGRQRPHTDDEWAETQESARRYMEDNRE